MMSDTADLNRFTRAAPFWLSLLMVPLIVIGGTVGGWTVLLVPLYGFGLFSVLDRLLGLNTANADPQTDEAELFWYRAVTLIWAPVQFLTLFWVIWYTTHTDTLGLLEVITLFYGVGAMTGAIGIVYAHELMHQKNHQERWLGDILLSMALYCHFRSEHLLVHHVAVGTPKDAVTARYNESFPHFFWRVLRDCPRSAWDAEVAKLTRKGLPATDPRNPFWRYAALQGGMLLLALILGGLPGLLLFLYQALVAVWMLELTNYVEHYGLTRKYLGNGRFEHVKPHHSWNAAHTATNWLLINLQRHSDHHTRPDRRFPLLQTYGNGEAPQLPFGYPAMTIMAMIPPLWRRRMNPRVRNWRRMYYPEITDWAPYKTGRHEGLAG
ncbi:MAG: alkane 1-monooxygenase [Rhodobacteraceae bacterium]|nr:alkane 1-monooxygenase [Paracoccaceae bacterium]MBR9821610.1 alkane 1-monooxygenase [Paracoccaceae bacterium]